MISAMRAPCLVTLGVLLCAASPGAAQTFDGSHVKFPPPHCVIAESSMVRVPVYAWVELPDARSEAYRTLAENLLQEFADRVPGLLGSSPDSLPRGEPAVRWSDLDNGVVVTGHRDGRITWRPAEPMNSTAAALLGRAVDSAIAGGARFPWDTSMTGDSVRFSIAFAWPTVDGTKHQHPLDLRQAATPLFSIAYPTLDAVVSKPGNYPPSYPSDARNDSFGGKVVMQFIVDTSGRAVMSTVHDVWKTGRPRLTGSMGRAYDDFRDAIRDVLPKYEFSPAVLGGSCKMPQRVEMPFVFNLTR